MASQSRSRKVDVLAEWLYGVKMAERECWVPDAYPPDDRVPWHLVSARWKQSYRDEAKEVLARLEGPGVGGGGGSARSGP